MSYERQTFVDHETVLEAAHLEHIEDGIVDLYSKVGSSRPEITFTVDMFDPEERDGAPGFTRTFKAEEGMTWAEFIASKYNICDELGYKFFVHKYNDTDVYGLGYVSVESTFIPDYGYPIGASVTDVITNGAEYCL